MEDTFKVRPQGEVVFARGPGGVIYDRFDLILPKGSNVRRVTGNRIDIETRKLRMAITVQFEGLCTVLPWGFEKHYMHITGRRDSVIEFKVDVAIGVSMKLGALLSAAGWQYYRWIDSFLDKIEEDLSKDAFFKLINWEPAFTILQCLEQAQQREVEDKKE